VRLQLCCLLLFSFAGVKPTIVQIVEIATKKIMKNSAIVNRFEQYCG